MNFRIEKWPAFKVAGVTTKVKREEAFQVIPTIWEEYFHNGTMKRIMDFFPDYRPAGFLGIAIEGQEEGKEEFDYLIGATNYVEDKECVHVDAPEGMMEYSFPETTWVIVDASGSLPKAVQNVYPEFYSKWLPTADYKVLNIPAIECYMQDEKQEVWFAVEKK